VLTTPPITDASQESASTPPSPWRPAPRGRVASNAPIGAKPRVLIFIVAYNAEKTIEPVVKRIPKELSEVYDLHVLIIDDASRDSTFAESYGVSHAEDLAFPIRALFNPVNQGYGGNQKLGYHYAIEHEFDFVALLHGDGQYPPECLPAMLEPLRRREAEAVIGSRMLADGGTVTGGMALYKFVGNRILTWIDNRLLHSNLSDFHSGYRAYSVAALRAIPFERNSKAFTFDAELIIQLLIARRKIRELPIPAYHSVEGRSGFGIKHAAKMVMVALKARLQELSLFYDRRFDCAPAETYSPYTPKLNYESTHTIALDRVRPGSRVLDLGCAGGYLGSTLRRQKRCFVRGVDMTPVARGVLDEFDICDFNARLPNIEASQYDAVLMLDVIEHLNRPEMFLEELRRKLALNPSLELLISTANVACFVTRAMLLIGQFNYGPRGILDITHTRLFTFASLRRALVQAGFEVIETTGVPAPYPMAIGDNFISRGLLAINRLLIRLSRGLFSYQIFMRAKAQPSLDVLLAAAELQSGIGASTIELAKLAAAVAAYSR
jgi:glycosyltransferase involved in cell wall biosynthesis